MSRATTTNRPKLSKLMHQALAQAARQELRRTHDGKPGSAPWPAPPASLNALVRRGLLERSERLSRTGLKLEVWTITSEGRTVLNPPPRTVRDTPNLLRVKGRAVTLLMRGDSWESVRVPEPEQMRLPDVFVEAARARHREAQDKRERARKVRAA